MDINTILFKNRKNIILASMVSGILYAMDIINKSMELPMIGNNAHYVVVGLLAVGMYLFLRVPTMSHSQSSYYPRQRPVVGGEPNPNTNGQATAPAYSRRETIFEKFDRPISPAEMAMAAEEPKQSKSNRYNIPDLMDGIQMPGKQ